MGLLEELKAKVAAMEAHYANVAREDTDDNGDPLPDPDDVAGAGVDEVTARNRAEDAKEAALLSEESDGDA